MYCTFTLHGLVSDDNNRVINEINTYEFLRRSTQKTINWGKELNENLPNGFLENYRLSSLFARDRLRQLPCIYLPVSTESFKHHSASTPSQNVRQSHDMK